METTTRTEHPSWCDRVDCVVTDDQPGTHRSPLITLDPDSFGKVRATVRIIAGIHCPGYQHSGAHLVEIMFAYPCGEAADEESHLVLRGERATALGHMLISAGREATISSR